MAVVVSFQWSDSVYQHWCQRTETSTLQPEKSTLSLQFHYLKLPTTTPAHVAMLLLSLRPSSLLMDGCVGNSTTVNQPHSITNICCNVGRRPDGVEAVPLAAENRLPIERLRIYATSLHPEWVTPREWSKEVNHAAKLLLSCVVSKTVIRPFLTARWRWRFWQKWRAFREVASILHLVWKESLFLWLVDRMWLNLCAI